MKGKVLASALCSVGALFGAGCATTGGSDSQSTLYDTHRMVTELDKDLGSTVTKLNETTAELYANVEASSTEQKRIYSLLEENQAQVRDMRKELRELKTAFYNQYGISVSSANAGGTGLTNPPEIEPPLGTPVAEPNEYGTSQTVPEPEEVVKINPSVGSSANVPSPSNIPAAGNPEEQYQKAQGAYAKNDYKTALGLFDEFMQLYPKSELAANAQFWKAKCNLDLQDYQASIREFEVMRSNFPSSTKVPFAMHNQAVAHERLGQIPQAKALLEDVIENYPVSPAADQARAGLEKLNKQ